MNDNPSKGEYFEVYYDKVLSTWVASACNILSYGFPNRESALAWVIEKMDAHILILHHAIEREGVQIP